MYTRSPPPIDTVPAPAFILTTTQQTSISKMISSVAQFLPAAIPCSHPTALPAMAMDISVPFGCQQHSGKRPGRIRSTSNHSIPSRGPIQPHFRTDIRHSPLVTSSTTMNDQDTSWNPCILPRPSAHPCSDTSLPLDSPVAWSGYGLKSDKTPQFRDGPHRSQDVAPSIERIKDGPEPAYLSARKIFTTLVRHCQYSVLNVAPHSRPKISPPANTPVHLSRPSPSYSTHTKGLIPVTAAARLIRNQSCF
ncbi:hypothetical protein ARMGADRAFT_1158269 [Armillaria gallica]|uniref:Uncharacterized protein n=1 Tax=Armillaria gallica TaxID=47427 RepID=A0A2H3EYZ4_ARMGA|nr:hypothetical protein ARMGADRAFT_1158269 [Armillaria gallica]